MYFKCLEDSKHSHNFRSLEAKSIEIMSLTVTAACVLHNLTLKNNDTMEIEDTNQYFLNEEINQDFGSSTAATQRQGINKRNDLTSW